jgi:hypothetical protein
MNENVDGSVGIEVGTGKVCFRLFVSLQSLALYTSRYREHRQTGEHLEQVSDIFEPEHGFAPFRHG